MHASPTLCFPNRHALVYSTRMRLLAFIFLPVSLPAARGGSWLCHESCNGNSRPAARAKDVEGAK